MATSRQGISNLQFTTLSPAIGVEISGIDLRRDIDPDALAEIRQA